jgi:hypothetical protein
MMNPLVLPQSDGTRIYAIRERLALQRQDPETREWRDYSTPIDERDWVLGAVITGDEVW